ncbi:hypothetical protein FRC03_011363, partial [Tulasnella sp. 419]
FEKQLNWLLVWSEYDTYGPLEEELGPSNNWKQEDLERVQGHLIEAFNEFGNRYHTDKVNCLLPLQQNYPPTVYAGAA